MTTTMPPAQSVVRCRVAVPVWTPATLGLLAAIASVACAHGEGSSRPSEERTSREEPEHGQAVSDGAQVAGAEGLLESGEAPTAPAALVRVRVPGGEQQIGVSFGLAIEAPSHREQVETFYITPTEVTVHQFDDCVREGCCSRLTSPVDELCNFALSARQNHPVNCIAWQQAASFCECRGGRLPTEAEWERAARGPQAHVYPWGSTLPTSEHLHWSGPENGGTYQDGTAEVGTHPEGDTALRIHDLAGNVSEWTSTLAVPYEGAAPEVVRELSGFSAYRIARGSDYATNDPDLVRSSMRFPLNEAAVSPGVGFRCVFDSPPP